MRITVVSPTNRRRWHLLRRTLTAAFAGGADRAIIVDNNSADNIAAKLAEFFPGRCSVVRFERDQGSAGAYYYGLKAALAEGAEYLFLLDDDNIVRADTIANLSSVYFAELENSAANSLCVAGFRREQERIRGENTEVEFPSGASFLGFHIKDIPARIWKRRPWNLGALRERNVVVPPQPVRRVVASFGGLLFHRSVIERFGYPDPRFVLYGDDTEFTYRITTGGGTIWLVPAAEIDDGESSWIAGSRRMVYFAAWIKRGSDEQVYYNIRNRSYLETHGQPRRWIRAVNRSVLFAILWVIALSAGRIGRCRLLMRAAKDGENGILGFYSQVKPEEEP